MVMKALTNPISVLYLDCELEKDTSHGRRFQENYRIGNSIVSCDRFAYHNVWDYDGRTGGYTGSDSSNECGASGME